VSFVIYPAVESVMIKSYLFYDTYDRTRCYCLFTYWDCFL